MNRRTFLLTSFSAAVAGYFGLIKEAFAVETQRYRCNVRDAANFDSDTKKPVGHLTSLKIGSTVAPKSWKLVDPENPDPSTWVETIGAITAIRWNGGTADPITFTCQVTVEGFKALAPLIYARDLDTRVEFAFTIYDRKDQPTYYKAFHSGDQLLKGVIEKNSGALEFEFDEEPGTEVPSPRNWELYLSIMPPASGEQTVYIGTSKDEQQSAKWGNT